VAKQIEHTIPPFEDGGDLAKSHIPPGANSVVNGVVYGEREVPVTQTVNGVTRPAGTVTVPTTSGKAG
jgi:hypothetical protein